MVRLSQGHAHIRREVLAGLATVLLVPSQVRTQPAAATEDKHSPLPQVGARLPLPDIALLDGTIFRAAEADGQVIVLYWWASWCPFCALQSPHMNTLWLTYKSRGLRVLGLSIDRKAEDAINYLAKKGYTFPAGLLSPSVARLLPKPKGLPVTVVRGRDGHVLAAEAGQLFQEDVEQIARFL